MWLTSFPWYSWFFILLAILSRLALKFMRVTSSGICWNLRRCIAVTSQSPCLSVEINALRLSIMAGPWPACKFRYNGVLFSLKTAYLFSLQTAWKISLLNFQNFAQNGVKKSSFNFSRFRSKRREKFPFLIFNFSLQTACLFSPPNWVIFSLIL